MSILLKVYNNIYPYFHSQIAKFLQFFQRLQLITNLPAKVLSIILAFKKGMSRDSICCYLHWYVQLKYETLMLVLCKKVNCKVKIIALDTFIRRLYFHTAQQIKTRELYRSRILVPNIDAMWQNSCLYFHTGKLKTNKRLGCHIWLWFWV